MLGESSDSGRFTQAPLDRYAYGIDFDQEEDAFMREYRELHAQGAADGNYQIFEVEGFGRFVRNRFSALVKKGDLMLRGQRAQTQEEYTCLDDNVSVKLFESTNNDAVFVDGVCSSFPCLFVMPPCNMSLLTVYFFSRDDQKIGSNKLDRAFRLSLPRKETK